MVSINPLSPLWWRNRHRQIVASGDICGTQEADEQAGGIKAVTLLGLQGHVRTLDGAEGGEGFDGVSDPAVDFDETVVANGFLKMA